MSEISQNEVIEFVDKFMQRLALGVFLLSIGYGLEAYLALNLEGTPDLIEDIQLIVTILMVLIILPQFIKMMRYRVFLKGVNCEPESFVVDVYKKAAERAFTFTFIALIGLDFMLSKFFQTLPSEFGVKAILSFTLLCFSISFFLLNKEGDIEDNDDFGEID